MVLAGVQHVGKALKAAAHHLGQQVVAAGVVLVRRLVAHAESARHIAQAQLLQPMLCNRVVGGLHAGFFEVNGFFGGGHAGIVLGLRGAMPLMSSAITRTGAHAAARLSAPSFLDNELGHSWRRLG